MQYKLAVSEVEEYTLNFYVLVKEKDTEQRFWAVGWQVTGAVSAERVLIWCGNEVRYA